MATVFKTFLNDDVVSARTLLHEAIPVTGSLVARTYDGPHSANSNIKQYPHGMFQSVYDYPYMSSSANHIFDITVGVAADSSNYDPANDKFAKKKKNIYNQMAQILVGHDTTGSILQFDQDGDFATGGTKYKDAIFINVARLLGKDEIRKGTFSLRIGIGEGVGKFGGNEEWACKIPGAADPAERFLADSPMPFEINKGTTEPQTYFKIEDYQAATDYRVNSPAGEYGILKITEVGYFDDAAFTPASGNGTDSYKQKTLSAGNLLQEYEKADAAEAPDALRVGLIYYQAGVIVLDPLLFVKGAQKAATGKTQVPTWTAGNPGSWSGGWIPYQHTGENNPGTAVVNNQAAAYAGGDNNPDWLRDDRGEDVLSGNYNTGTNTMNEAAWGALANTSDIAYNSITDALKNSHGEATINEFCNGLRNRIFDMKFNNTTELNSTIYFCRVNHNDYNYSSNPTYLGEEDSSGNATGNNSKIRVKRTTNDAPVSYVTTIGLYSADNELLAVAKLSEPLKKDPQNEMILRVRLDY